MLENWSEQQAQVLERWRGWSIQNKLSATSGAPSRHGDVVAMMAIILCLPNDSYNLMEGLLPIGNTIWLESNIGDHGANTSFRRAKDQESGITVLLGRSNEA